MTELYLTVVPVPVEPPAGATDGVAEVPGVVEVPEVIPGVVVVELVPGTAGTTPDPDCERLDVDPGVFDVLPDVFSILPGVVIVLVILPGVVTPVDGDVKPPVESPEGLVPDWDGTEVP